MALHDMYIKLPADPSLFAPLLQTTDTQDLLRLLMLIVVGLAIIGTVVLLGVVYAVRSASIRRRKERYFDDKMDEILKRQAVSQAELSTRFQEQAEWMSATRRLPYLPVPEETASRLREWGTEELDELFDSLSATEIALWSFTSPNRLNAPSPTPLGASRITATAKEAYLWAAAVAHVLEKRPDTKISQILDALTFAVRETVTKNVEYFSGWSISPLSEEEQKRLVENFVFSASGVKVEFAQIEQDAQEAYETLLWRGLVEDPLWKEIGGTALVVAMVFPIHWTNKDPALYDCLAFTYRQEQRGDHVERDFKFHVLEVSEAVADEIGPSFMKIIHKVAQTHEDPMKDPGPRAEDQARLVNPPAQLQRALKDAGFDPGPIDGRFGKKGADALKAFQEAHHLPVTGKPDEESRRLLGLRSGPNYKGRDIKRH
ncbi:peptidoglycan-binding domain-containing protein [Paraburkholderia nemoris]|uniref:peptidoglycan-binding domain-containing protein n=1 Tax=Paraburkholderia nemoris TaxID=2793076 RepID=UPI001B154F96|nr:peptidoglycan-binding protein [Paraburkholderia nemoris]CAE6804140.1 hypothetical protein LMG22931_05553 [Paraburkholderia nemoris]